VVWKIRQRTKIIQNRRSWNRGLIRKQEIDLFVCSL
jgi:hypothetical protein